MDIKHEVIEQIKRMQHLHNQFSHGEYVALNNYYSEAFTGYLFMPTTGKVETYDCNTIKDGNKQGAQFYNGQHISFTYTNLEVIVQTPEQAAVSYRVHFQGADHEVFGLSIEVWKKEEDHVWRMVRWYEEKGEAAAPPS
ncbi:DUF4440 domain-containing protein [Geomicrobium sp. JCM 19039]|uniref:DUF4440 domain-containing protein n=1 Tax=Geomicrobium sp. JCM 19039 TaxID=1460636 RepID=UPI00045F1640|nr:DUF4440 domain-containing protein [Geomicrobium sp. JCM 19039]GAK14620.1 hypothetical protein JCM19039_4555 [Geomicrobium sp. JCM 19039]